MERYQYKKLKQGEIRLLKFCASSEEDLCFEFQHATLNENTPAFAALSYTWGKAIFPHRLLVGKAFLPITTHLRDALVHIRGRIASKSDHLKRSTLLWVDAICINQSDIDEKNAQVPLMFDLYTRASKIYVWLGMPENEPHIRAACSKLRYFYKRQQSSGKAQVHLRPLWWPNKPGTGDVFDVVSNFKPDDKMVFDIEGSDTHDAWRGIVEIWKKPWWNRAWVLQESTVVEDDRTLWFGFGPWPIWASSPHFKVIFLCGKYSTNWVAIIISIIVADYLQGMPLLNTAFIAGTQENARRVLALRMQRRKPEHSELLELLQRFRHAECSNPRDKLYALLGFVPSPIRVHILPDYRKSVIDVYIDSFRHTLQGPCPSLDFLGYAMKMDKPRRELSKETSYATWPSWIPNWDDPLPLHPLPKALYSVQRNNHRSLIMFKKNPELGLITKALVGKAYNASLNSTAKVSISNHQLKVDGIRVDVIADLFSYQTMSWGERRAKLTEWKRLLNERYGTDESYDDALARLQVADVQYDGLGHAIARNNAVNNPLLEKLNDRLTPEEIQAKRAMRLALDAATKYRGLCRTAQNKIALVPWSARRKDRICALLGGQVLYVLRDVDAERFGNSFHYIGECYVHGLMDGEAMRGVQTRETAVENFTLV